MTRNPKIKLPNTNPCGCGHRELDHVRQNGVRMKCQVYVGGAPNLCPCKAYKPPAKLL